MKATSDRLLTAIYCDDVRHEVGNKMSFMGCYQSELFVQSAPIALPRLCIFVTVITPISRPFKSLTLRVMQDETNELARMEFPPEGFQKPAEIQDGTATRSSINTAMMFSPFMIEKATVLRVVADTEEGEVVGPRLLIKIAPDALQPVALTPTDLSPSVPEKKTRKKKAATQA